MPRPKATPTGVKGQYSKKAKTLVRNPNDKDNTLFCVGFQEGELVWAGHKIVGVAEDYVMLKDAKEWPNWAKVPYSLDVLREGVLHSDDLVLALTLTKAIDLRMELVRRKKARIDKQLNAIQLLQRALAEGDQVGLRAMTATQTR